MLGRALTYLVLYSTLGMMVCPSARPVTVLAHPFRSCDGRGALNCCHRRTTKYRPSARHGRRIPHRWIRTRQRERRIRCFPLLRRCVRDKLKMTRRTRNRARLPTTVVVGSRASMKGLWHGLQHMSVPCRPLNSLPVRRLSCLPVNRSRLLRLVQPRFRQPTVDFRPFNHAERPCRLVDRACPVREDVVGSAGHRAGGISWGCPRRRTGIR